MLAPNSTRNVGADYRLRWSEALPEWIGSQVNAFTAIGGVTGAVVCDNLKAGVTATCRYEPARCSSQSSCSVTPLRLSSRCSAGQSGCGRRALISASTVEAG
jgi:hypothetical protein